MGSVNADGTDYVSGFFSEITQSKGESLDSIFSNSKNAQSVGVEKYSALLANNFSQGKSIDIILNLKIANKLLFSISKSGFDERLKLVFEDLGENKYVYHDRLDDLFWDSFLGTFSIRNIDYKEDYYFLYPLKYFGYTHDRILLSDIGVCCFVRISDSARVMEGADLKEASEYHKYHKFLIGLNESKVPDGLFFSEKDRLRVVTSLQADSTSLSYWDYGDAVRLYKGINSSILVFEKDDLTKVVLFVGNDGNEKIYGLTKRTLIDKLTWMNYVFL